MTAAIVAGTLAVAALNAIAATLGGWLWYLGDPNLRGARSFWLLAARRSLGGRRSIYSGPHEGLPVPPRMILRARTSVAAASVTLALLVAGCGSQGIQLSSSSPYHHGAVLFRDHCSGCH